MGQQHLGLVGRVVTGEVFGQDSIGLAGSKGDPDLGLKKEIINWTLANTYLQNCFDL